MNPEGADSLPGYEYGTLNSVDSFSFLILINRPVRRSRILLVSWSGWQDILFLNNHVGRRARWQVDAF